MQQSSVESSRVAWQIQIVLLQILWDPAAQSGVIQHNPVAQVEDQEIDGERGRESMCLCVYTATEGGRGGAKKEKKGCPTFISPWWIALSVHFCWIQRFPHICVKLWFGQGEADTQQLSHMSLLTAVGHGALMKTKKLKTPSPSPLGATLTQRYIRPWGKCMTFLPMPSPHNHVLYSTVSNCMHKIWWHGTCRAGMTSQARTCRS